MTVEQFIGQLAEGADVFVSMIQPLLASTLSLARARADGIGLVAAVSTSAAFGFLVLEAIEHGIHRRTRPVLSSVATTGFWGGVVAVPLASMVAPGVAMAFTTGLFVFTAILRARLVRMRLGAPSSDSGSST